MSWSKSDWERLGDYVTAGRVRLDMSRYDLASGSGLSVRTLADIENGELGRRKAFSAETLEALGACLQWRPGSWRRVLNGDEPAYDDQAPPPEPARVRADEDETIDMVPDIIAALDKMSSVERRAILNLVETFGHRDLLEEGEPTARADVVSNVTLDIADDYDLAARRGVSEGQRARRAQDEAGEESQDHGGSDGGASP